jgi:hypothetical protein
MKKFRFINSLCAMLLFSTNPVISLLTASSSYSASSILIYYLIIGAVALLDCAVFARYQKQIHANGTVPAAARRVPAGAVWGCHIALAAVIAVLSFRLYSSF